MNSSLLVPNFRDVGETINILAGRPILKERILFRGGELGLVTDLKAIESPQTIVNLRKGVDPEYNDAKVLHFAAPDSQDVYLANLGMNRKWIVSILKTLGSDTTASPIFIHCAAGKDRTGVIIAAILSFIGVERRHIIEDYQLSAGPLYPELFAQSLDAFAQQDYFRRIDRDAVATRFLET